MVEETKAKKNPDYSKTAVNLCNPPMVMGLLDELHQTQLDVTALKAELRKKEGDLLNSIAAAEFAINEITKEIKSAVSQYGGYQNVDAGFYALQYTRTSKEYHAEPLKALYPKFAPLCIQEIVNVAALEGQVKGKVITEVELKLAGVMTETTQEAWKIV